MDDLDHKIIQLLAENARMPVKDIAQQVNLTSPAVSSRIHRLEQEGIIGGYTVVLRHPDAPARVEALISVLVDAATRASFLAMIRAGIPGAAMLPRDRQLQLYHKGQLHRH